MLGTVYDWIRGLEGAMQGSLPVAFAAAFAAGILTSLTPCVYPMIPLVTGYVGGRGAQTRRRAFLRSLLYALGLALTFAVLGAVAASAGQIFGRVQTHPISNLVVGNILILVALSMMGAFVIPVPGFLTRATNSKAIDNLGPLFMGAASGFVAAPCTLGIVAVMLTFVAKGQRAGLPLAEKIQQIGLGATLLFTYALGFGLLLVAAGTFSGIVARLPKSGRWLTVLEKVFGMMLLAGGEFFILQAGKRLAGAAS